MAEIDYDALIEALMNRFMTMNASTIQIGDKVYRNLEAQVRKNQKDIQDLDLEALATLPDRVTTLEGEVDTLTDANLPSRMNSAEGDIDLLQVDVARLDTRIDNCQKKAIKRTVTLPLLSWVNNTVTVTVLGVTADNLVFVSPDADSYLTYGENTVRCTSQNTDVLTFTCETEPTVDITVNVVIWNNWG